MSAREFLGRGKRRTSRSVPERRVLLISEWSATRRKGPPESREPSSSRHLTENALSAEMVNVDRIFSYSGVEFREEVTLLIYLALPGVQHDNPF
jgi:hypothetical protein